LYNSRKRHLIKVVFRGSVTVRDWVADGDSIFATVPNPLANEDCLIRQSKFVSIHRGFHTYLFAKPSPDRPSKYETIIDHLKSLLDSYRGYRVRVCGHSLGGALSTVFAFQAACDNALPRPLLCCTFASPRVGNLDFARAFQECEVSGKLRCIRVVNDKDVVTTVPDRLAYALCCTNSIYRHVGIEIRLFRHDTLLHPKPRIHFPVCHHGAFRHFLDDCGAAVRNWFTRPVNVLFSCREDFGRWHSCQEYSDRLAKAGEHLRLLSLDQLVDDYRKHCMHNKVESADQPSPVSVA
jgi:Lipase (class 3)